MAKILVLQGPNLNLLGSREPDTYGDITLEHIHEALTDQANEAGHQLVTFQSNSEGELIDRIQNAANEKIDVILFNPAAYTHTSVALRDAMLGVDIPFFEIHLSNIYQREPFRHYSYFSDIAEGVIAGLGSDGYMLALIAAMSRFNPEA